jgi:hypothetical protein
MMFWYRQCAVCDQGQLWICEDVSRGHLYLHCDECEWGCRDPERAGDRAAYFLTLNESFESRDADRATIERYG